MRTDTNTISEYTFYPYTVKCENCNSLYAGSWKILKSEDIRETTSGTFSSSSRNYTEDNSRVAKIELGLRKKVLENNKGTLYVDPCSECGYVQSYAQSPYFIREKKNAKKFTNTLFLVGIVLFSVPWLMALGGELGIVIILAVLSIAIPAFLMYFLIPKLKSNKLAKEFSNPKKIGPGDAITLGFNIDETLKNLGDKS